MAFGTGGAPTSSGEASVHGGGPSAKSGTTRRPTASAKERQRLFADTIARLSRALEYLDSTLLASTTLPNRERSEEHTSELQSQR